MENIEIENIRLVSMHVSINQEKIEYDANKVQAMLQVQYNFEKKEEKFISYRIVVGENPEKSLYHVKCEYRFTLINDDFLDQDIITAAMDNLQPRIEEMLALITLEAGLAPTSTLDN